MRPAFYDDLLVTRPFQLFFNDLLAPVAALPKEPVGFTPPYEVEETDEKYVLSFDVPGIERGDLNIELLGTKLTVSGERKLKDNRHRTFSLTFTLKDGVTADQVEAIHRDGVLTLAVKKPPAARPARIAVS